MGQNIGAIKWLTSCHVKFFSVKGGTHVSPLGVVIKLLDSRSVMHDVEDYILLDRAI